MRDVFICLGSNIKPQEHLRCAIKTLQQRFQQPIVSNVYESRAVGFQGDNFLNVVVKICTDMSLDDVLGFVDSLEKEAGRVRVERGRFDSRTLDADVIMYGDYSGQCQGKDFPSSDITDYAHVLLPLVDLIGDQVHPSLGVNFNDLLEQFNDERQKVWQVQLEA